MAANPKTFQSVGTTPFGFDVGQRDRVFVSEAAGGAGNASSASSYEISEDGDLAVISGAVPTQQTAACWLITSPNERFVYTANAGSGSISGFRVGPRGRLELLEADGRTGGTGDGSHPTDMAQSRDGHFLYSLNNGNGTVSAFRGECYSPWGLAFSATARIASNLAVTSGSSLSLGTRASGSRWSGASIRLSAWPRPGTPESYRSQAPEPKWPRHAPVEE